jgi:hypothetical protein
MSKKNQTQFILNKVISMLENDADYSHIINFIEEYSNYSDDDIDDVDGDSDNGYSYSQQRSSDVLDYTRELYERGRIDYMQMQEMRIGA